MCFNFFVYFILILLVLFFLHKITRPGYTRRDFFAIGTNQSAIPTRIVHNNSCGSHAKQLIIYIDGYNYSENPKIYLDGEEWIPDQFYTDHNLLSYSYVYCVPVSFCVNEHRIVTTLSEKIMPEMRIIERS